MSTAKKKNKIALPPAALNSPAMMDVISRGGSVLEEPAPVAKPAPKPEVVRDPKLEPVGEDVLKSFTFKIYESELAQIRDILAKRPKRDRISIHDFIVSAVKEKITKEGKRTTK